MLMDRLYLDNNFRILFLSFYCFSYRCCCFVVVIVVVASSFVMLLIILFYFFIILVLIFCGFVSYHFLSGYSAFLLFIFVAYGGCFYVIFNICNFSIAFLTALSWIPFTYLLTVSLLNFPYNVIVRNNYYCHFSEGTRTLTRKICIWHQSKV